MSKPLCSTCQTINFRKYLHESRFFGSGPLAYLGSWQQICKRTHCAFCCLVRDAFYFHDCVPTDNNMMIMLSHRRSWKCCISYNEYHGIRSKYYSNEIELHAHAVRTHTENLYQFVVYWERGPGRFVEVFLRPLREGPFSGRIVDQQHADLSLFEKWLDLCHDNHNNNLGQCLGKKTSKRFLRGRLRLIDVDKLIIIRGLPDEARYVALSYVWGEDIMKRDLHMTMPLSLKAAVRVDNCGVETIELPELLPRTILDSIDVTRSLGYRYLWVDSLCIVQDDLEETNAQMNMMDEIYGNANLTIAAASGSHADWGLCGISRPRHFAQRCATIDGIKLAVEFPSFRDINSNTSIIWNTRGWTLQEKLLSKRILLFTDFQVYFRCSNSVCSEDIAMEAGTLSDSVKKRQNPFKWGSQREAPTTLMRVGDFITLDKLKLTDKSWNLTFLPNYIALIEEFSQRSFTLKKDTLKAIAGVLKTWSTSDTDLDFPGGLPRDWLSDALLWQPRNGSEYVIDHTTGIPTWSWASWTLSEGCVWSEYGTNVARGEHSITIHVENRGGEPISYRIKPQHKEPWLVRTGNVAPLPNHMRQHLKCSGTLLAFQTPVCFFRIGEPVHRSRNSSCDTLQTYYLLDSINQRVGKIWTCDRIAKMPRGHDFVALSTRHGGTGLKNAVAEKYIPTEKISGGSTIDPQSGISYPARDIETTVDIEDWIVVNVMLVQWENDIAFRVAVGQIISTAWAKEGEQLVYLG